MTSSEQTLPKKPPLNHTTFNQNLTDGTALIPCLPLQEPIHVVDSLWRQGGLLCALASRYVHNYYLPCTPFELMENETTLIAQCGKRCLGGLLSSFLFPCSTNPSFPSIPASFGGISLSAYYGQILHVKHVAAAGD